MTWAEWGVTGLGLLLAGCGSGSAASNMPSTDAGADGADAEPQFDAGLAEPDAAAPVPDLTLPDNCNDGGANAGSRWQDQGLVFQTGKNGIGYLLKMGGLGGVGGEIYSGSVPAGCGGVFGATAYASGMLYLPCGSNVVALQVSNNPPAFSLAWQGPGEQGQPTVGAPIVAAGAVWNVDLSGRVLALDEATGNQRFAGQLPGPPNKFAALAYGGGQVYVATPDGVAAFQLEGLTTSTGQ